MKKYINVNTGYEFTEEEIVWHAVMFYQEADYNSFYEYYDRIMADMKEIEDNPKEQLSCQGRP